LKHLKIYKLIGTFSKKEQDQLESMLCSKMLNIRQEELSIYKYIIDCITSDKDPDKEVLFQKTYGKKHKYNDQKIRLAISKLFKQVEKFCILLELGSGNEELEDLLLLRYYRKKNLSTLYKSQYNSIMSNNRSAKRKTLPFDFLLDIEFENYQYESLQKRNQELNIQVLLDLTDMNFYTQKLRIACYALSHKNIYSAEYDFRYTEEIIKDIEDRDLLSIPVISVYYHCYQMMRKIDDESIYRSFRNALFTHQENFNQDELRSLYFFALNFCIRKLNKGDKSYGKEGLDLYETAIKMKTLFIDGKLSRFTYRNMAMMAIRNEDFERAEMISDEYENLLRSQDRKSAYHFNKALIYYYKKEFDLALENIIEADFKDHLISLAAKTLQAKIYFELENDKVLDSHLDSMEMYIIRNKILGYHKNNYKNIIKYFKKLVRLNPYDKEMKIKFAEKVKGEEVLTEKKWILEKVKG